MHVVVSHLHLREPLPAATHEALQEGVKRAKQMRKDEILLINVSGRGDKDVNQIAKLLGVTLR